jgi:mono/diheme cytochrome c family protein
MHQARILALLGPLTLTVAAAAAQEPEIPEQMVAGSSVYRTYCTVCHGPGGKGDGPLANSLRFRPPDLTLLARKNGGKFPKERVLRTVDGRNPVKGHGGPDMPVWGDAFRSAETGYDEAAVRARVRSVVDHVKTIQAPAR